MKLFSGKESGQAAVLAVLLVMVFVLLASALVDGYSLLEARTWGYEAAQQAAMAGVSQGRDWNSLATPPCSGGPAPIRLVSSTAASVSTTFLNRELAQRGVPNAVYDVRVLPNYTGGSIAGFPPSPVRLGAGRGSWSTTEPSVGVYLSFPVTTFLMSFVGRPTVQINVFASASVHQPTGACTP